MVISQRNSFFTVESKNFRKGHHLGLHIIFTKIDSFWMSAEVLIKALLKKNTDWSRNMIDFFSVCGCDCSKCDYFQKKECIDCQQIQGKVWWIDYLNVDLCPIYNCVINTKKIESCGLCAEIPCNLWYDLKDPNHSNEQHNQSVAERIKSLKKLQGI